MQPHRASPATPPARMTTPTTAWSIAAPLAAALYAAAFLSSAAATARAGQWVPRFAARDMDNSVNSMTIFDDGSGPALFVGGNFTMAGHTFANKITKWQDDDWHPLDGGIGASSGFVWAMTTFDDGSGPALFVVGDFIVAGGQTVNRIAKWDGVHWYPVGGGMNSTIRGALTTFDDGTGLALYAGGDFTTAGGIEASHIAKWDGVKWSPVGGGTEGVYNSVRALLVHNDGSGPALYAGGSFASAGGVTVNGIARWNGSEWSALGAGVGAPTPSARLVRGLGIYNDGTGLALYATGQFSTAGDVSAPGIAKWDGAEWSAVGTGLGADPPSAMTGRRLAVLNDGYQSLLVVCGTFTTAGGRPANYIARWNGNNWAPLGAGLDYTVYAITVFDEGDGPALFTGGSFMMAGGVSARRIAKWVPGPPTPFDCDDDGDVDLADLAAFATCLAGPEVRVIPGCAVINDSDGDTDVDVADFAAFQRTFADIAQ